MPFLRRDFRQMQLQTTMNRITILGSTGSIGSQTLDIIAEYPDRFAAHCLIAGSNAALLAEQAKKAKAKSAIIADESRFAALRDALAGTGIEALCGRQAILDAMTDADADTVVTATVGYSGLEPTIHAISAGKKIALANKETLVVAGELITDLLRRSASTVIPVDSEHSAIYQCLMGETPESVRQLIITASGGPFRAMTIDQLRTVTPAEALRHPNWTMGAKITIDSATMLNKAFEIIEAHWLFGVGAEKIKAVVHPQSIIHSLVEFVDGSVKAQLGLPDMHLPIRYALGETERLATDAERLSLTDCGPLEFYEPDTERFPCISLAYEALRRGGNTACVVNAANEIANAAFLRGEIGFLDIYRIIVATLEMAQFVASPSFEDYVASNAEAREIAKTMI